MILNKKKKGLERIIELLLVTHCPLSANLISESMFHPFRDARCHQTFCTQFKDWAAKMAVINHILAQSTFF